MSNVVHVRRSAAAPLCLLLVALAWPGPGCASRPGGAGVKPPAGETFGDRTPTWPEPTLPAAVRVKVSVKGASPVVTLPLEEYVAGAVRAEVLPSTLRARSASAALDAQAVVSRTYAAANLGRHAAEGYDLCDTTHCQVYRPAAPGDAQGDAAARAVWATLGLVLTYEGRVIQALFHADCGGHTAAAATVWGGTQAPYLESVEDWWCAGRPEARWTFAAEERGLLQALNADARTRVGERIQRVEIVSRDASGRALAVTLVGSKTMSTRAETFRAVVTQSFGARSIRSTRFETSRDRALLRFAGVGFGHGVGLCQGGTARRAEAGQTPAEILAHYFAGTRLQTGRTARAKPALAGSLFSR